MLAAVALVLPALAAPAQAAQPPAVPPPAARIATPPLPAIDLPSLPPAAAAAIAPVMAEARTRPDDADVVGRLGIALHAWEQWDVAAASYARARALAPRDPAWWHLAGLLETARGRHAEAAGLFGRAVALAPADPVAKLRLAEARLEAGDLAASAPIFAELRSHPTAAAAAEYGLGRIAAAQGRHEAALAHYARAVERFPNFGAAHYAMALSLRRLQRSAEAGEALARQQACVPCWPESPDPLAARVRDARDDAAARLARAVGLAQAGEVEPAIAGHLEALAARPDLAQAHVNLVALYGKAGRWREAEAHYRKALGGGANPAEAHANFGEVLLGQGRFEEAAAAFRQAIAVTPQYAAAHNGLGTALESAGDRAGALAAYRRAVADGPGLRLARFNHARLLVGAGRLDEAITELEQLQSPEDGETPRYRFALSAALVRAGQVARGRDVAQSALALARRFDQRELAAAIERDLGSLR